MIINLSLAVEYKEVILPKPKITEKGIEECISHRRSVRSFKNDDLTMEQISSLLWACQGITEPVWKFRTAPSAGATYPLEVLVAKKDGLFRYVPLTNKILQLSKKDLRGELSRASLNQEFIAQAPVVFIITAIYARTTGRYGNRGIRYVYIEVGHAAQNLHLMAVALGLGSVPVGAFDDDAIKKILNLPENEEPLYIIPVGYQK